MIWVNGRPRRIRGYTDFGPIRIPPVPRNVVLEDRDTVGTYWLLSFTTTPPGPDGDGYVSINSTIPAQDIQLYKQFSEPVLGTHPTIKLFVRGGYLGMEVYELDQGVSDRDDARIVARSSSYREGREIIVPEGFTFNNDVTTFSDISELAWEVLEF